MTAHRADAKQPPSKDVDITFGIYRRQDGHLAMGNKVVQLNGNKKTLNVDDSEYKLTPDLELFIVQKHPRASQYNTNDYRAYKNLVAQTKVKSFPNPAGTARPHTTWRYQHILKQMIVYGERIVEVESEDTDDTDTASIGD